MVRAEIEAALAEVEQARQNLDWAQPEFVDAAVYGLVAAELKVRALVRQAKAEGAKAAGYCRYHNMFLSEEEMRRRRCAARTRLPWGRRPCRHLKRLERRDGRGGSKEGAP